METLNPKQLGKLIIQTWGENSLYEDGNIGGIYAWITKGKLNKEVTINMDGYDLSIIVIDDPKHRLTPAQVCQIMDEGNHCLSEGSIFYEGNQAIITWSNYGHI